MTSGMLRPALEPLERARKQDARAFQELVEPHIAAVRRIALAFCRRQTDADDLAQEALLKAYRSLSTFDGTGPIAPWLYAVTRSVCHDWYRAERVRKQKAQVEFKEGQHGGEEQAAQSRPGNQEALLASKDRSEQLWNAIRTLDPIFRIPLVLFDIEGLSYEEVARIERVPVGTVRSRLSRARQRLHVLLEGVLDSGEQELTESGTLSRPLPSSPARVVR
jgi:RNA polymerase sigma-70 factor, ECF subfamily